MKKIVLLVVAVLLFLPACTKEPIDITESTPPEKEITEENVSMPDLSDENADNTKEQEAFEIFSELNKDALTVLTWYTSDPTDDLKIATESEYAPYYKVGRFTTIDEMKTATNAIFTSAFTKKIFYDHAFVEQFEDFYMYKEINGELYRNMDSGGMGWLYEITDEYSVAYIDDEKIIIMVKNFLPEEEEVWVNFLLKKENGVWKFDTYYDFNPYIEQERFIAPAVSSWFCSEDWQDANDLSANSLINFYLYTYLFNLTEEYNDEVGYEVPSSDVLAGLSVYLKDVELETLTAINENSYANASYNEDTDSFYFYITFDPANYIITNSEINDGITTLEVTVIGKDNKVSYYGYLDLEIGKDGFRFNDTSGGADGFKYVRNRVVNV